MAEATVYTIDDKNLVVEQFDCEWEDAMHQYWSKPCRKGRYYVARKGARIPYKTKPKFLKNVLPSSGKD